MRARRWLQVAALVGVVALTSGCAYITRASSDPSGNVGDGASYAGVLSANGRYVAFGSDASNLVAGDTNGNGDIFRRDLTTGTTIRVSVTNDGSQVTYGGDVYSGVAISADGRYVAFVSEEPLVPDDTNGYYDVYVRDVVAGTTERVSVASGGGQTEGSAGGVAISSDGRYVAFESYASDLVPNDTNGTDDVFVHDRETDTTDRASIGSGDGNPDSASYGPSISADGRYVAFETDATNIVEPDTNDNSDVVVYDRNMGTTVRASSDSAGNQGAGYVQYAAISGNGRYVVFEGSYADTFVAGDTNNASDVFVKDLQTGETSRVSVTNGGAEANGGSDSPAIDDSGNRVTFRSFATNLLPGVGDDSTGEIYVRDRAAGTTRLVSTNKYLGQIALGDVLGTNSISADGRYVAFTSTADNVVAGTDDNFAEDLFVRSVPQPAVTGVAPGSAVPGATGVPVTITGSGFAGVPIVYTSPGGVSFSGVTLVDDSTITATMSVDAGAAVGPRNVWVVDGGTGPGILAGGAGVCASCLSIGP